MRDAFAWAAIFVAAGFFEEVALRGIAFRLLEEWLGSAAALLISSAFFGLVHGTNPHATWFARGSGLPSCHGAAPGRSAPR